MDDLVAEVATLRAEVARLREQLDAVLNPWRVVEFRQIGPRRMVVERRSNTRCESVEIDVPPKGVTAHFAGCMLGVFVCCKGDTLIMRIIGNTTGRGRVLSGMTEDIPTARVFVVAPFDHAPIPFPNFHDGEVHDG